MNKDALSCNKFLLDISTLHICIIWLSWLGKTVINTEGIEFLINQLRGGGGKNVD
jgi:hypothetical protein